MKSVAVKCIAAAAAVVAASSSWAASVSGTGFKATYDESLNRFGTVDSTTPNSFTWLFSGEALTQTFAVTGGNKVLVNLPQVTFEVLDGYTINAITFQVQGVGNGLVYSNDGFDTGSVVFSPGVFKYTATDFAPFITPAKPFDLTGMSFWVQSMGGLATATSGTFSVSVSAVPEPETLAMLLAGLGVVGALARRRKDA